MAVKLVALDIDGTIVPPGADVPSPRITAAVRTLTDSGIAVVLASGRMFPGTARIARHLGLGTPVVCQQGCSVHSLDGAMLHEFPIERDLAMAVVDYARERNHVYEWFNPLRYIASRETPATTEYGHVSGITPEYMDRPETAGVRPTGVGVISSPGEASTIHRELVARHSQELHLLDFPGVTVGVGLDANKGHALSLLDEALRHLVCEPAAERVSAQEIRAPRLHAPDGLDVGRRHLLDTARRLLPPVEPAGLEPVKGLIFVQVQREAVIRERRSGDRMDAEERRPRAPRAPGGGAGSRARPPGSRASTTAACGPSARGTRGARRARTPRWRG